MKPAKPKTYEEYKAEREAAERSKAEFAAQYGRSAPMIMAKLRVPATPTELLQQFFALRYNGVPKKTVLGALNKAYQGDSMKE
jgi:hypothetical protein